MKNNYQNSLNMENVDLDTVILKVLREKTGIKDENLTDAWMALWMLFDPSIALNKVKMCIKEAISQALVLASEKVTSDSTPDEDGQCVSWINKQSILDVEKLIV